MTPNYNFKMDVTDLDHLVRLGFPLDQARNALITTNGDKSAAIFILSRFWS
jgi:hypothetical protein